MDALFYDFKTLTWCVKSLMNVGEIGEWRKMKARKSWKVAPELELFLINTRASPQLSHPQSKTVRKRRFNVWTMNVKTARLLWLKQFFVYSPRNYTLSLNSSTILHSIPATESALTAALDMRRYENSRFVWWWNFASGKKGRNNFRI